MQPLPDMGKTLRKTMLIRADATPSLGTGHVMRCLALAQAAQPLGWDVRMAGRVAVPWVVERLGKEGIPFTPLEGDVPGEENPAELLRQIGAESSGWVVLDGYHFGPDCQKAVIQAGRKLLVIDDCAHLPEYACDILLNQNIGAERLSYNIRTDKTLFGPGYALLRKEFALARNTARKRTFPEKARNVLLSFGGGDLSPLLEKLAPSFLLPELAGCTVRVIAGKMSPGRIRQLLRGCPASLEVMEAVTDMSSLMLWADICITAGGSTCWELCCMGTPFLTVEAAENQRPICHWLHEKKIAPEFSVDAFQRYIFDASLRAKAYAAGMETVRGNGAEKVIERMARKGC
jgi:UDP-2,4-diacetamido-2,4,6-trideoxy-beta-L-altropyranose hydrolase